jgi:3D (Asp-Asp-Asp) domain-containing protein
MTALLAATAIAVSSTSYCLHGTMADGTGVRAGSVAHNGYRLGTRLTISPAPGGRRRWVVRDRIGWGTELDFWQPSCSAAIAWGRRTVRIRRGWHRRRHLIGTWQPELNRSSIYPHGYSRPAPTAIAALRPALLRP